MRLELSRRTRDRSAPAVTLATMRRRFSSRAGRSVIGMAQSSPRRSGRTAW